MKYPDHDEIKDPTPGLSAEAAKALHPVIVAGQNDYRALHRRGNITITEPEHIKLLCDYAERVFNVLTGRVRPQNYTDERSFRNANEACAETAFMFAHYLYKDATNGGRMLRIWHREIANRLETLVSRRDDLWWAAQAEPTVEPHEGRMEQMPQLRVIPATRGPQTETAYRIATFIAEAAKAANRKISKTDFWQAANYEDRTEFERFQREDDDTTETAKRNFERLLSLGPVEFLALVDKKRRK